MKEITLGRNKRFDIDTIGVILSLLAPKGIEILTIDKGCVLQTTSAAASQQRMVSRPTISSDWFVLFILYHIFSIFCKLHYLK